VHADVIDVANALAVERDADTVVGSTASERVLASAPLGRSMHRYFDPRCLVLATLVLTGCAPLSRVPALSMGRVETSAETFERLKTLVQARGYLPTQANAARGTIHFASSYSRPGIHYTFTVQCYREGWCSVIPHGPRVRRDRDGWLMPGPLRREYVDLSIALADALTRSSERFR
jgi:hypothetical protein